MPVSRLAKLLNIKKAEAPLRAYAYLTASMGARTGVSDVLDCLTPFVVAGVAEQDGDAMDWGRLRLFLRSFGLRIPVFVLKQLEQRLEKLGAIEWNQQIDAFICRAPKEQLNTTLNIDLAFDAIEEALSFFADGTYSVERPPASDTWSDALIEFLRSESGENLVNSPDKGARPAQKIKKVKETLVAGQNFERFIVARFIQEYENDNEIFSKILQVFTGVLIEDFLSNIQTLPENANYAAVSIYYDTGVLLRLLGTSGAVLQNTTMEMHNALRGLKCRTVYLPNTRGEVDEILNNFLKKRAAGEIHPETAEALANGDLKESDVVGLSGTYSVRLEHMGIRLSKLASQAKGQEYQINVSELAGALVAEAVSRRRSYLKKSAENDARAIATILRLRAGHVTGALSESRRVFVTRNPLLQAVTRQYALDNIEYYFQGAIPPVLTVEQVATMAWLASSNKMEPIKVTRELLANCYNAARPSANWTKEFQSILDTYMAKDPRTAQQLANSAIFLHTARNMALDATIGQESLLKKLRIQDLLNAAAIRDREREEAYRNELDRLRSKAEREKAAADETKSKLDQAERRAKDAESNRQMAEEARSAADSAFVVALKEAEREFIRQTSEQRRQWIAEQQNKNATKIQLASTSVARGIRLTIQVAFVAAFTALAVLISLDFWQKDTWWYFSMLGLAGVGALLANVHLTGVEVVAAPMQHVERALAHRLEDIFSRIFLDRHEPSRTPEQRTEPHFTSLDAARSHDRRDAMQ